jgi:hypothetical protein
VPEQERHRLERRLLGDVRALLERDGGGFGDLRVDRRAPPGTESSNCSNLSVAATRFPIDAGSA